MNKYDVKENIHLFNNQKITCWKFDCWYKVDGIPLVRYIFSKNKELAIEQFIIMYPLLAYDEPYEYELGDFVLSTPHIII